MSRHKSMGKSWLPKIWTVFLASAMVGVVFSLPVRAYVSVGDTAPVPYVPTGSSWVNVSESSKVYFEDYDNGSTSLSFDDRRIVYVASGASCQRGSMTAVGPVLVDGGSSCDNAYTPYDASTRRGAIPLGFSINFFGTTYDSVYANTNGSITFASAFTDYDDSAFDAVRSAQSSMLFAYSVDLEHRIFSNFWYAQTTIAGKSAAVFSWENYVPHHVNPTALGQATEASFQIVIVNQGAGDFDAFFNYDKVQLVAGASQGYTGNRFWIDLSDDVTVGSNIVRTGYAYTLSTSCTSYSDTNVVPDKSSITDADFKVKTTDQDFYAKRESSTTVSFWEDSGCTVPILSSSLQNTSATNAYVEYRTNTNVNDFAAAIGWGTYRASPLTMEVTELFPNTSLNDLKNGGSQELIRQSINTSVVGRIVLGQRGGETVGDPNDPESPAIEGSVAPVSVKSDRLPRFDQEGTVLGASEGSLLLTGHRLYCTTEIKINNSPASFSHSAMPAGDGRAKLEISLPKLDPGYHQISMDSCGGFVTYDRFLYVSQAPAVIQGKVGNSLERANLIIRLQQWARENRNDYNSVECIINTRSLSQENAKSLAKDMCSKTFGRLASPKSYVLTIRENSSHVQIWYKVILSNQ